MRRRQFGSAAIAAALLLAAPAARAAGTATPAATASPAPAGAAKSAGKATANPVVVFQTTLGRFEVELYPDKAPLTVKNFLGYVEAKQYDGTIFHRVIRDFMIQGGGMTADLSEKPTREPVRNEADNGLRNEVGAIAMARTSQVDSATAQFFINTKDNEFLNHRAKTPSGWGYAVFGKVISGLDVVRKIEAVKTGNRGVHQDVPATAVVIESVRVR